MAIIPVNKEICLNSAYLRMSDGAKALYVLLLLLADSAGICDRELAVKVGNHTDAEISELTANGLTYEIGNAIVIRHWYYHNLPARRAKKSTAFLSVRNVLIVRNWLYEVKPGLDVKDQNDVCEEDIRMSDVF